SGEDLELKLAEIRRDPRVESAQAMNVFETQGTQYDDPYAAMQPAIEVLSIEAAHQRATGRGVTVAVIDSRVDARHPEIRGRVEKRLDLVNGSRSSRAAEVHGTAVAGVIASTANNAEGIVGVAPDVKLASLRACWTVDSVSGRAQCSSFSLAQALETAIAFEVDIVNMSLSGPSDPLLERLIDEALQQGIIVVAAVPDTPDAGDFPASHSGVIAGAGSSNQAVMAGQRDVLRAPGTEVLSTTPNGRYAFFSGNSMSAAYVAGVAALLVEHRPGITAAEVRRVLAETSSGDSINACRAVARLVNGSNCDDVSGLLAAGNEG
ncbi:MAG: S8 family serine peptidase, partial [Gammaproteobacteria bacterium]|nr:S8 family serine peptidase [Gammaproteobacteria bacterium]